MKILILTREYKSSLLPACGGTGSFNAILAHQLVKKGHQVVVFGVYKTKIHFDDYGVEVCFKKSLFKRNPFVNLLRSISKKVSFLEKLHFYIHRLEKKDIAKQLIKFIDNQKIDIIETHDFEGLSLFLPSKIPCVIRCHGSYSVLQKYFDYKNIEKGRIHCEQLAFKKASNIIAVSEFSKKANTELFDLQDMKVIYNGVDLQEFKPNQTHEIIPFSIFFLGNVSIDKGAEIAMKVFLEIIKKIPEASLHFIGREGSLKKEFEKTIELNQLKNNIVFYGYQKKEKIIELLNTANVVVFPSRGENFSIALLEVMALEKFVITSNIDAYKELIVNEFNGFIANNEADYIKTIETIFENKVDNQISKNARKTIENNFSVDKMINETIAYYNKILTSKL